MTNLNSVLHHQWLPDKSGPASILICVHGLGLHGGCFKHFGSAVARRGIAVYAHDVRGFGSWKLQDSPRVSFEQTLDDLVRAICALRSHYDNVPIYLIGESMGGAVSLRFAALHEELLDGLVLCAPASDESDHFFNVVEVFLSFYCAPQRRLKLYKPVIEKAIREKELREAWLEDELSTHDIHPRDLVALRDLIRQNYNSASNVQRVPVLLLQGYGDRCISPHASLLLFEALRTVNKSLVYIGDAEHLLFQSPHLHEQALKLLLGWLDGQSGPRPPWTALAQQGKLDDEVAA